VLAVWAQRVGFTAPALKWVVDRGYVATHAPGLSRLDYLYPPLPVLLSVVLPGHELSLAVCCALFSGTMLAGLILQAGVRDAIVLVLPLVGVPAMWYAASELLPQVVAMTFLAVALRGFLQFAVHGETYGGFIAGLALAVAYSADPGALVYAVLMCAFVPMISRGRYRGDPHAAVGVCAVLAFPCLAMAVAWSFLLWRFTGRWPGNLHYAPHAHTLAFPGGVVGAIVPALRSALADAARSVLYVGVAVLVSVRTRDPLVGLALVVPVAGLAGALWLGFDYSPVAAFFLLTLLAFTVATQYRLLEGKAGWLMVLALVVTQVGVAIVWTPTSIGYISWLHHVMPYHWMIRLFGQGLP
jgi:hypothetical protein